MRTRLVVTLIISVVLTSLAFAQVADGQSDLRRVVTSAEINDAFSQAKRYFSEGNELQEDDPSSSIERYEKSLLYFETLVTDAGIHNGKLFYNIGNVYFRLGDIGNAILNYRRAMEYSPNDPNIANNLEFARTQRRDTIESDERSQIAGIIFFWHRDLASHIRFLIFVISFVLIWLFLSVRQIFGLRGFVWAAVAMAFIAALFFGSLTWETVSSNRNISGVIVVEEVIGRKGNSATYQPSFQDALHAGTEFVLREDRGDWFLIRLTDGRETWVPEKSVGLVRR